MNPRLQLAAMFVAASLNGIVINNKTALKMADNLIADELSSRPKDDLNCDHLWAELPSRPGHYYCPRCQEVTKA